MRKKQKKNTDNRNEREDIIYSSGLIRIRECCLKFHVTDQIKIYKSVEKFYSPYTRGDRRPENQL